jgi:hypothetical protein
MVDTAIVNTLHLWTQRQHNPEKADAKSSMVWVAGLIEEIIQKYADCDCPSQCELRALVQLEAARGWGY